METFLVTSWAEHVRQHERFTRGDRDVEAQLREHLEEEPVAQHFIRAGDSSSRPSVSIAASSAPRAVSA